MLEQILTVNIYLFLLIFVRIGVFFFIVPGIGGIQVKSQTRLALALAVTFLMTPVLSELIPPMPASPIMLGVLIIGEVLAGGILGAVILTIFSAVQVAGTVTSFVSAMANALIFDPISQQQSAIVAGFLSATAVTLMFATNLHHVFIEAMINSYTLFPPGEVPNTGDMAHLLSRHVNDSFNLGVRLAAPFIVVSMAYYLGLGILTRLSPQVPIFFVAMPLQIVISIVILATVIPALMLAFFGHVQAGLQPFLAP